MADRSIREIFDDIQQAVKDQGLRISSDFFSSENIPDSLKDDVFVIAPIPLEAGDMAEPNDRLPFWNIKTGVGVNVSFQFPANNVLTAIKELAYKVESIIKAVLSIDCGGNEKDSIVFVDATPSIEKENTLLIYEINFSLNYHIKNI